MDNNDKNNAVHRTQNADDLLRVVAVVGHAAEVAWSNYVQGRIDVVFPAGTKPEVVEAVVRDIGALVPPVPHVGIRHPIGADCESPCIYCATQKEADLRGASGPALLHGMARAAEWKGMSTAEISERLTRQWEALSAHGGSPEVPTSPIPAGALLSPVQAALDAVKDRVPESVYVGMSAVVLGTHRAAVATQERNEQRVLAEVARLTANRAPAGTAQGTDMNAEVQRRVDELLQGPRPAVLDCDGRRLREVLRSWIHGERERLAPSSSDDRETIPALRQQIDDLTRCLTSQAQAASIGATARALLQKARVWLQKSATTPSDWRQFDLDVIAIDDFLRHPATRFSVGVRVMAPQRANSKGGRVEQIESGRYLVIHDDGARAWWAADELVTWEDYVRTRLTELHQRIAQLPPEQKRVAMRRASRSYSVPESCIRYDGCVRDGGDIVWPDGERYPTRHEGEDKAAS